MLQNLYRLHIKAKGYLFLVFIHISQKNSALNLN